MIENHVHFRLISSPNKDAVMMALRLLIVKAIDVLGTMHTNHSKEQSDVSESSLLLCVTFFSCIVDSVRRCTTNLQFASLLLEVGRQVEPSNLDYLYPLPISGGGIPGVIASNNITITNNNNRRSGFLDSSTARTVVDLFTMCIDEGSVATASSALPLMTSKHQARHYCGLLLDEAIDSFVRNTHQSKNGFDTTEEERRVMGDIFGFGMKLEDADLYEEDRMVVTRDKNKKNKKNNRHGTLHRREQPSDDAEDTNDRTNDSRSTMTDNDDDDDLVADLSDPGGGRGSRFICGTGTSTILNYIVPSSIRGESEKKQIEAAIKKEASVFIKNSLDNPSLGFTSLPDWDDYRAFLDDAPPQDDINSVAGIVGDALLDLLQPNRTDINWTAMAALATLLLQDGTTTTTVSSSYRHLSKIAGKVTPNDILLILPDFYDTRIDIESNLISFLDSEMELCRIQVTESWRGMQIVDLALLVLDRIDALPLPDKDDQTVMELGLVFIILVAGSTCGRSIDILKSLTDDCILALCYEEVLSSSS
jgi:hypothetical protein